MCSGLVEASIADPQGRPEHYVSAVHTTSSLSFHRQSVQDTEALVAWGNDLCMCFLETVVQDTQHSASARPASQHGTIPAKQGKCMCNTSNAYMPLVMAPLSVKGQLQILQQARIKLS